MSLKEITWLELMKHTTTNDCWVLIEGKIYDVSSYLAEHPGGDDILTKNAGKDATQQFKDVNHSDYAVSLREQRIVGYIEKGEQPEAYKKWCVESKQITTKYTWEQVKRHNTKEDLWVVMEGKVYDLSKYINKHPGGPAPIMGKAGRDATMAFEMAKHPTFAIKSKENYQIGLIDGADPRPVGDGKSGVMNPIVILIVILLGALAYHFFGQALI